MIERQRIEEAYRRRQKLYVGDRYSWTNPATAFHLQSQERAVLDLLARNGLKDLDGQRILEVGCGSGSELRNFIKYGARPENLSGVDILSHRVKLCRKLSPNIDVKKADASCLPYPDGNFDLVCQFVMFTSIIDFDVKAGVAAEMMRVVKKNGLIIWYDYFVSKPGNSDVRGVRKRELKKLFPGCGMEFQRVTLAAPVSRAVVPVSWRLASMLELVPWLRSHYLVAIRKRS